MATVYLDGHYGYAFGDKYFLGQDNFLSPYLLFLSFPPRDAMASLEEKCEEAKILAQELALHAQQATQAARGALALARTPQRRAARVWLRQSQVLAERLAGSVTLCKEGQVPSALLIPLSAPATAAVRRVSGEIHSHSRLARQRADGNKISAVGNDNVFG